MCAACCVTPRATVTVYGFSADTSDCLCANASRDFGGFRRRDPPRLRLEQQVDGALAGLMPTPIGLGIGQFTRPR